MEPKDPRVRASFWAAGRMVTASALSLNLAPPALIEGHRSGPGPERALAGVLRLQPALERLVALEARIVRNGRRERVGLHQMARGMTVATGFRSIERVLDHGPAEQRRRKRVSPPSKCR